MVPRTELARSHTVASVTRKILHGDHLKAIKRRNGYLNSVKHTS